MEPFFNTIEKVKWVRLGESSHTPFLEEPEEFLKVVNGFLSLKLSMQ
jgi:pimeloyl-ACP methyl ester carboxylesterase